MKKKRKVDAGLIVGIALIVVGIVAIVLLLRFTWRRLNPTEPERQAQVEEATPMPASSPAPVQTTAPAGALPQPQVVTASPAATEPAPPTVTQAPTTEAPLAEAPTAAPEPTAIPTEPPPASPAATAGDAGVNVRQGPGTNYTRIGALAPGATVPVTGKYGNWWQIDYNGRAGWVFGDIVTTRETEAVPEVQPPPPPTAVPPTATPVPQPTATPVPAADFRGLVPNSYWVENAPGPFGVNQLIWFNWDVNVPSGDYFYEAIGTWVQETGQFQQSWTEGPYLPKTWRDHIEIADAGAYRLWLRVCWSDGYCANLAGPISVTVQ